MYDQEIDTSAPYDNVEFPVRKSGTGTWPGPASSSDSLSAITKTYGGHQTTGRSMGASKLAPLVEVEGSEGGENSRLQTLNFGTTAVTSTGATSQQPTQQQTTTSKVNQTSGAQQNKIVAAANTVKSEGSVGSTTLSTSSATSSWSSAAVTTTTSTVSTITSPTAINTSLTTVQSGRQDKVGKPTDSNTYVATQFTSSDSSKTKTLKQIEAEDEEFKRQDLNPGSRLALERVYTLHPDFYQLNSKVLDEGTLLKQDVREIYKRTGETLTYEQLLQGILVDGERFLLGNCWLHYTHVQFLDLEGTKALREPYGKGRIGLTNKRALFLSTEIYTDANLEQFETASPPTPNSRGVCPQPGYKLEVSKRSCVTFKNIPINNFHSAEMEVVTGTAAQTKITKQVGCCACFGVTGRWTATPPMTRAISSRVLRVGVSMPPWQTRMFLDIHLDPSMSLTVARDFISQLHSFAPHMH